MRLKKFEDHLNARLQDPEYAAAYMEAALESGGIEELLYALREVVVAQNGGMQRVADDSGRGRESLYKSLSKKGNPSINTVSSILRSVGARIAITHDAAAIREQSPEVTHAS